MTEGVSFDGQVVIVTGAGGGLGRTYAVDIARRGGAVVVNDLGASVAGEGASSTMADAVVDEIRGHGGTAIASHDDVASLEGARRIVASALETFGQVDALINNAGNMRLKNFDALTLEDLNALLAVHIGGAFNCSLAVWPHLKAQGGGRIVFTTSSGGVLGGNMLAAYGAAKGGVMGLMHSLAVEGAEFGILCNALMPNAVTRMTATVKPNDMGENPWAAKIASTFTAEFCTGLAVFLASKSCTTTHGIYSALGGRVARAFVGMTHGLQGSLTRPLTADEIATNWEVIRDDTFGYGIPESLADEFRLVTETAKL